MSIRKPIIIAAVLVVIGAFIALVWVRFIGGREFLLGLAQMQPIYLLPLLGITAVFLFTRFIRWQFLLRQVDVRIPTKPSLSVYLASLIGTATPAYIGEVILRSAFNRLRFGVKIGITVWIFLIERLFDVIALGLIGLLTVSTTGLRAVMGLFIVAAVAAILILNLVAGRFGIVNNGVKQPHIWLQSLLLSLAAWVPTALLLTVAGLSMGQPVTPATSMGIFSSSTLLGGLTLMPAGVGSTGSLAIFQLQEMGLVLAQAIIVISIMRLTSTGVVMIVSAVFLVHELLTNRSHKPEQQEHFDDIAAEYGDQFQPHIWDYLLNRKISYITDYITPENGVGLDLGCGLGQQCTEMERRGFQMVGLDIAIQLLEHAHQDGVVVTNGSALELPFKNNSLAFAYTVGVLHHLPNADFQAEACQEIARVLKPDGYFIVHETNPRNPMFRLYMGYIFPLLKSIDEGIESWLEPQRWEEIEGLQLVDVVYFTFLPDFIPPALMKPFRSVERWLESSRLRPYSVHYMAVLQKEANITAPLQTQNKNRRQPTAAVYPTNQQTANVQ
ncbi:MAG: methyltransferase domain-containing protein [Chloroflexi bacterium]|nr:methyltransferase domain-containing protein [Chloroflexota bacterium]